MRGSKSPSFCLRTPNGSVENRLLSRSEESRLTIAKQERAWTLDADGGSGTWSRTVSGGCRHNREKFL